MAVFPTAVSTDSDLYIAVNAKSTQLTDNPLTAGATTVNVVSTTGFPTVGFISIDNEIIKYTGVTPTSFTGCTRAADGTTATSHVQNSQVFHNVIAIHHNALKDEIIALEQNISTRFGLGSTNVTINSGDFAVDTNVLYVQASTNRVGLNVSSPLKVLDVRGASEGLVLIAPTDDLNAANDILQITNAALTNVFNISKAGAFTARANSTQIVASGESKFTVQATAASQSATLQLNTSNATTGQLTIYMGDGVSATKGKINYDPSTNKFTVDTNSVTSFVLDSAHDMWSAVGTTNSAKIAYLKFPTDSAASRYAAVASFRGTDAANIDLRFYTMAGDTGGVLERMRINNTGEVGIGGTAVTQLGVATAGATSAPANSGTTPASGTVIRIKAASNAVLDFGSNSTTYAWLQSTDQTGLNATYPIALNPNGGDVFSTDYTDYSGTSTVNGWSSFTTKLIYYKKLGKTVHVWFRILGTSNATTATFTVPFTSANTVPTNTCGVSVDNGTATTTGGQINLNQNSVTVQCYKDMAAAAFTASGSKEVTGHFTYQTA